MSKVREVMNGDVAEIQRSSKLRAVIAAESALARDVEVGDTRILDEFLARAVGCDTRGVGCYGKAHESPHFQMIP